jgi:hypothetical protein
MFRSSALHLPSTGAATRGVLPLMTGKKIRSKTKRPYQRAIVLTGDFL